MTPLHLIAHPSRSTPMTLAVVSDAVAAAAAHLRQEFQLTDALEVSLRCGARYAALRVLLGLPQDWTVEHVVTALQAAPVYPDAETCAELAARDGGAA